MFDHVNDGSSGVPCGSGSEIPTAGDTPAPAPPLVPTTPAPAPPLVPMPAPHLPFEWWHPIHECS